MRKFRNAAIAGMTAVTLVAGLNTTVFAAENETTEGAQSQAIKNGKPANERDSFSKTKPNEKKCADLGYNLELQDAVNLGDLDCKTKLFQDDAKDFSSKPTTSSVWGKRYDATQDVYGIDLLGQDKNFSDQPVWSQIWYVATILGVVGTIIGIGYLPVMNQLKAMGYII